MKKTNIIYLIPVMLFVFSCSKSTDAKWYKGNLHTHSYWSDGNDFPEMIMKWYKEQGYDFVALSDHNILAEGEKWIEIRKGADREQSFRNYLEIYGDNWVEFEELDELYRIKLKTLKEYRTLFEGEGNFLIIKSEEITDGFEDKPIHVNATNIQELIEPQGGNSVAEVMQNNIDAVIRQRDETGVPMFPHVNHPNFGWAVTADDLKKLENERFFEVYNGHPLVHNFGDSLHSGTEQMWDEVNTHYLLTGKPLLYGIAVDDAHHYQEFNSSRANPGRGWIYVKSEKLTAEAIIEAMENGSFYASTGVRLRDVHTDGNSHSVKVDAEEGINYTIRFIGTLSGSPDKPGEVLKTVSGTEAAYTFSGNELFIRAKVDSDKLKKNPFTEGEREMAWTQPVKINSSAPVIEE